MTVNRRIFFAVVFLVCPFFVLHSQANVTGVSLETEIRNLEKTISASDVSPEKRHDALVSLARLRQLSGDIEGAAKNWLEAAAAVKGQVDDDALLACAYCLAAMGEWDRARMALEPLLIKSSRARFLYTSINAISTENVSALGEIAVNPEYAAYKNEIYFLLWKTLREIKKDISSAEIWRQRLVAEFPQTPEGRLAAGGAANVSIKPSPFWLLIGGGALSLEGKTAAVTQSPAAAVSAAQTAVPVSQSSAVSQTRLQTGLFGKQANAQAQAASLRQAGFSPSIEQRIINSGEMWAVTVQAGADTNRVIRELREAGFESFPIK
jgi:tetratricopeptide (TPR) repeat protein